MLYGVDYLNMLKGTYAIALFDNENDASDFFKKLEKLWHGEVEDVDAWQDEDYVMAYNDVFEPVIAIVEEVDWREIGDYMENVSYQQNINGRVSTFTDDVKVINTYGHAYVPC